MCSGPVLHRTYTWHVAPFKQGLERHGLYADAVQPLGPRPVPMVPALHWQRKPRSLSETGAMSYFIFTFLF
jgi:hypothetical protein